MTNFLEYFPRIPYDIYRTELSDFQIITDITYRVSILREVLNNVGSYYYYTIKDGETPEVLAEAVYKDPEAHWVILYANNIYDPQYDWPLIGRSFRKYMVNKYRSSAAASLGLSTATITDTQIISWAQDTTNPDSVHHYEKQITRYNSSDDTTLQINLEINRTTIVYDLNDTLENVPYDFYTGDPGDPRALEYGGSYETFSVNGKTVNQTIKGAAITYYDYENELNESKRLIKVIKSEYYTQIIKEFKALTDTRTERYLRRLT
jgi:hypothetical protein